MIGNVRERTPRVYNAADHIRVGCKVRVYRNLHQGCLSVQVNVGGSRWRVACHADVVSLTDVSFRVSQAGRVRVLRERKKNVHALVEGRVADGQFAHVPISWFAKIRYSPYDGVPGFHRSDNPTVLSGALRMVIGIHWMLAQNPV